MQKSQHQQYQRDTYI